MKACCAALAVSLLLPTICLLPGCTLIDQRTFDPNAGKLVTVPPPPGPAPVPPLVAIDFARPNPDYAAALHQAVQDALSRKPDVQFDVVTLVPAIGTVAQQAAAAAALTPDSREVAQAIGAEGVDDDRIHLMARTAPGLATRQIQLFVH